MSHFVEFVYRRPDHAPGRSGNTAYHVAGPATIPPPDKNRSRDAGRVGFCSFQRDFTAPETSKQGSGNEFRAAPVSSHHRGNMRSPMRRFFAALIFCLTGCVFTVAHAASAPVWNVPAVTRTLANGLKVVVSEDHSAPTFGVCVSYGIGFRLEPEGRTGFAHLFEHMMFEGTPNAPKGTLDSVIEGGGGNNNGDTRYDFTEYIETAPVSALDPILWIEADRMKTLDFSPANLENQRKVVEEEVRVNVLNQPYGLFFAIDLPGKAFNTYPNLHNFYGDFKDLDAAKIGDVENFYKQYYSPNNAVLAVAGDVNPAEVFAKAEKYFGSVPSRPTPPRVNTEEAPQTAERSFVETDKLANVPALAVGYRMPARGSRDAIVAAVTGELLHNGQAS